MHDRPLWKRLWYDALWVICRVAALLLFQIRITGREHQIATGPVLVCSNHQSHFDPVLIGLSLDRRLNYLARRSLFRFTPFRWLIDSLQAIPIERDGLGIQGLKETLRRLKKGQAVVIFPEGTRTRDGELGQIKPGFSALARRGKATLLPMAIEGAYAAWPRTQKFPRLGRIHVCIGPAITPDVASELDDELLLSELESRIRTCFDKAKV